MKKSSIQQNNLLLKIQATVEDFIAFIDSLFYEGYAEQLAAQYPEEFNRQLNQFLDEHFKNS